MICGDSPQLWRVVMRFNRGVCALRVTAVGKNADVGLRSPAATAILPVAFTYPSPGFTRAQPSRFCARSPELCANAAIFGGLEKIKPPFGAALIKKSNGASRGVHCHTSNIVTYLRVRRRNMKSLLRPIVGTVSMEAIVIAAYSSDSLDRESAGHEKANSRRQTVFTS